LFSRLQRNEITRSLKTSDPIVARRRAGAVALSVARLWGAIRKAVNKEEIDAIVRDWLRARLHDDRVQRTETDFAEDFAGRAGMAPGRAAAYLVGSDAEGELERGQRVIRDHDWRAAEP
jgi:hypothetical protein